MLDKNCTVTYQWNIEKISRLLESYAEVKFIALYRNSAAMTYLHSRLDGGLMNNAEMAAEFLQYQNDCLVQLDKRAVKVVRNEDLRDNQVKIASPLANCLDVGKANKKTISNIF